MLNFRRAPQDPPRTPAQPADDGWDDAYHDAGQPYGQDLRIDEIADALAAEFDALHRQSGLVSDPMDPVDLRTGGIHGRGQHAYDHWDDEALEQLAEELAQYDDFDPQTLQQGVLPPHPPAEEVAAPHGGSRAGRLGLVLGLVGLVAAGGAGWALFGPGALPGFGDPVVVAAPSEPYKIVPKEGDTIDEPIETAVSFDPVTGLPPKGEERLVEREEDVPDLPGVTPQVNRVILPDGQEIAEEVPPPVDTGPRRVRTVLVRPDGSIIESPDRPAQAAPSPADPQLATDSSPIAQAIAAAEGQSAAGLPPLPASEQVEAVADDPVAALLPPLPDTPVEGNPVAVVPPAAADQAASVSTTAIAETPIDAAPPAAVEQPPVEVAAADPAAAAGPAVVVDGAAVVDAPMPRSRPTPPPIVAEVPVAAPAEPTQVAAIGDAVPVVASSAAQSAEIATAAAEPAPAAAAPAAPAPAGAAFVQVSSQRSEAAALSAFSELQQRFPTLLAGLSPDVQRADLGAKGIYYRARIAKPSRQEAVQLCESLKSVGADCLIARR